MVESGGFDSLKTAMLQCIQSRDEEILAALLQTEVNEGYLERMKKQLSTL